MKNSEYLGRISKLIPEIVPQNIHFNSTTDYPEEMVSHFNYDMTIELINSAIAHRSDCNV